MLISVKQSDGIKEFTFGIQHQAKTVSLGIRFLILNDNDLKTVTAILILVVSSAVLLRDVSARAGHESIGTASFPIGWIMFLPFERLSNG